MAKGAGLAGWGGADQQIGRQIGPPQYAEHLPRMSRGALMGSAHDGNIFLSEAVALADAGGEHGQRLERLEGRTGKDGGGAVAGHGQRTPTAIGHDSLAMMDRFGQPLPQDMD